MTNLVLFIGLAIGFAFGCERLGAVLYRGILFRDRYSEWIEAWGLGAALLTGVLVLLSLAGGLVPVVLYGLWGGLLLAGGWGVFRISWKRFTRISPGEAGLTPIAVRVSLLVLVAVCFATVLTPETRHDPYDYHLTIPALYLAEGSAVEIPWHVFSYMPKNGEVLFALALGVGNDSFAKLIHFLFGGAVLMLVYTFLRRIHSHESGLLGAFLVISLPLYGFLATSAYIDLIRAFWELFALYWLYNAWRAADEGDADRYAFLSALTGGMALGTKYVSWGVFAFPFLVLYVLLAIGGGWRRVVRWGGVGSLLFFLPVLPWLVLNALWTGNPVYPLLPGLFGMHIPPAEEAYAFFRGHAPPVEQVSTWQVIPFAIERVRFLLLDGNALVLLGSVALLAGAIWRWKQPSRIVPGAVYYGILAYAGIASVLFVLLTDNRDGRFFVSVLFLLSVPTAVLLQTLGDYMRRFTGLHPVFLPAVVVIVFTNAVTYRYAQLMDLQETIVPQWTEEQRTVFLTQHFDHYPLLHWANEHLPDEALVLCAGYPLRHKHVARLKFGYWPPLYDFDATNPEALALRLHEAGVTHIVSPFTTLARGVDLAILGTDFLRPVYRERSHVVYELLMPLRRE